MNSPSFKRYQPAGLRLWHWLNVLIILGLLSTAALRKTVLGWRPIAALIDQQAQAAGAVLSSDLVRKMAIGIRDIVWDWHYVFGYGLGVLLILRILVAILYKDFPIRAAWVGIKACQDRGVSSRREALHYALVKCGYVSFYIATLFMVVSGLIMRFRESLGMPKGPLEVIHEAHEVLMWYFLAFIAAHVAGVILGELTRYRGIVSDMIHGGEKTRGKL